MNLKGRKAVAEVTSVEGDLLEKAFDKKEGNVTVNINDVDTSDLETSDSINDFLESLPPSAAFEKDAKETDENEEPAKEVLKKENKKAKKGPEKANSSGKMADEFKKIRRQNEEHFKELLADFQKEVEENDASSFEISSNKSYLIKMFELEGFDVEKKQNGIIVRF